MPLYEYACSKCEKVHEMVQKFSDAPLKKCPDCKGPVEKLLSATSFALRGKGWYVTDYKRSGGGETKAASPEPKAKPASDASAKNST